MTASVTHGRACVGANRPRYRSSGVPGCSASSRASSLGFETGAGVVEHVVFEPHRLHAPEHPIAFSALQRGHRTSGESNPQLGHFGRIAI